MYLLCTQAISIMAKCLTKNNIGEFFFNQWELQGNYLKLQKNTLSEILNQQKQQTIVLDSQGPQMVEWPNQDRDFQNKKPSKPRIEGNLFSWMVDIQELKPITKIILNGETEALSAYHFHSTLFRDPNHHRMTRKTKAKANKRKICSGGRHQYSLPPFLQ